MIPLDIAVLIRGMAVGMGALLLCRVVWYTSIAATARLAGWVHLLTDGWFDPLDDDDDDSIGDVLMLGLYMSLNAALFLLPFCVACIYDQQALQDVSATAFGIDFALTLTYRIVPKVGPTKGGQDG
jgi:hypothetical protein